MNIIVTGPYSETINLFSEILSSHPQIDILESGINDLLFNKNGLIELGRSLETCFHVNRSSKKIRDFDSLCRNHLLSNEYSILDNFLDEIVAFEYEGMPFCDRSELSPVKTILFEQKRRKAKKNKRKPKMGSMYIPAEREHFRKNAVNFLNQLIRKRTENDAHSLIILPGIFPAIARYLIYIPDSFIICLHHNPLQLYSLYCQESDPWFGNNPDRFCSWFVNSRLIFQQEKHHIQNAIEIQYEEWVQNPELTVRGIFKKLEIDEHSLNLEKFNDGQKRHTPDYKRVCSKREIDMIKSRCTSSRPVSNKVHTAGGEND